MGALRQEVGVTWFREEDYPALLEIFEDAERMPLTWKQWLKQAEQIEERAKAQGYATVRVYIDPESFVDWCLREGKRADREGRQKFAIDKLAAKSVDQSGPCSGFQSLALGGMRRGFSPPERLRDGTTTCLYFSDDFENEIRRCVQSWENQSPITITGVTVEGQIKDFTGTVQAIDRDPQHALGKLWRVIIRELGPPTKEIVQ
jgi:hypothetical protein